MPDNIIVAVIWVVLIVGGIIGCVFATKKGHAGFGGATKTFRKTEESEKAFEKGEESSDFRE